MTINGMVRRVLVAHLEVEFELHIYKVLILPYAKVEEGREVGPAIFQLQTFTTEAYERFRDRRDLTLSSEGTGIFYR
jgi:hypothetical protein